MRKLKTVGIKKLKNGLSAYIREVKGGTVILVTDHGRAVAEPRTPEKEYHQVKRAALRQEWIDSNKLHMPVYSKKQLAQSQVRLHDGTSTRIIDLDRKESG